MARPRWAAGTVRTVPAELQWVLDPDDHVACVQAMTDLHDLAAGRVVCHPIPGTTWPTLVRNLLQALGKRRDALARERRVRDGADLAGVWLRAEDIRHLIVLRAHLLRPGLLHQLAELAGAAASVTVWLVWHHPDPPPTRWPHHVWPDWADAAAAIRGHQRPAQTSGAKRGELSYRDVLARARREARLWRIDPPRQRRFTEPACALGAVVQRLTIDAETPAEVQACLRAIHAGFAAEGLVLTMPTDPAAVAALGPRLTPDTLDRLRRIACPNSAAALMLALATDAAARSVAGCATYWISPTAGQVGLLPGTYRIPLRARPLLRAAVLDHTARGLPDYRLLADRDGGLLLTQRMANLIGRAAAHASLPPPPAATSARRDRGPDGPFAADFTRHTSLTAAEPNQTVLTGRRTLVTELDRQSRTPRSPTRAADVLPRSPSRHQLLTSRAAIADISCGFPLTVERRSNDSAPALAGMAVGSARP